MALSLTQFADHLDAFIRLLSLKGKQELFSLVRIARKENQLSAGTICPGRGLGELDSAF